MTAPVSYHLLIQGAVQGQGIRPALARLAESQRWSGRVYNTSQGVRLSIHGVSVSPSELERHVRWAHPALETAEISLHSAEPPEDARFQGEELGFQIEDSRNTASASVPVPRDVAICPDCLAEFHAADNKRHLHGLISCVRCGPRYSIIRELPYDRARTTLTEFPLCSDCRGEYDSRPQRRHHAQTISCPQCGPQLWVTDRVGRQIAAGDGACQLAARALLAGQIVALRGVGGYQLLVDAMSDTAVTMLRQRKRRATKPLAVLCRTLSDAQQMGVFDHAAKEALVSPANPIVIVPRKWNQALAAGIHPHLNDIGLLLPTTAVHDRLLELCGRPLVCTSGNLEGAPLVVDVEAALEEFAAVADLFLHHNRRIHQPIDDSVVRSIAGRVITIRCARGLAPLPLPLSLDSSTTNSHPTQPLVALGGFQKSACAWWNGAQAALGPHIGDLSDLITRERWRQSLDKHLALFRCEHPRYIADSHPDDVARQLISPDIKPLTVWHHQAHIAVGMLEQGWFTEQVIGIAADGQGFGPAGQFSDDQFSRELFGNGQLWGGEVLLTSLSGFRRIATLRSYALPGGEVAVHDPARIVVSLWSQLAGVSPQHIAQVTGLTTARVSSLLAATKARMTPWTSSLGRVFDAISWLILGQRQPGYPGEPAAQLEAMCDPSAEGRYDWNLNTEQEPWQIDWRPMFRRVLQDYVAGIAPGIIAERFHRGVATWMRDVHQRCPPLPLVLGGGVFQNRRLCELIAADWPVSGPPLGLPGRIPPNDGGLAAGQLAIAAAQLGREETITTSRRREQPCA